MTRLPMRIICWLRSSVSLSSGAVTNRRRRASISEGEAWSSTISSTCHEAETAAIPPSVRTIMSGMVIPAVFKSWAVLRALSRFWRASRITISCSVPIVLRGESRGSSITRWLSRLRAGMSSCARCASLSNAMRYIHPPESAILTRTVLYYFTHAFVCSSGTVPSTALKHAAAVRVKVIFTQERAP